MAVVKQIMNREWIEDMFESICDVIILEQPVLAI